MNNSHNNFIFQPCQSDGQIIIATFFLYFFKLLLENNMFHKNTIIPKKIVLKLITQQKNRLQSN